MLVNSIRRGEEEYFKRNEPQQQIFLQQSSFTLYRRQTLPTSSRSTKKGEQVERWEHKKGLFFLKIFTNLRPLVRSVDWAKHEKLFNRTQFPPPNRPQPDNHVLIVQLMAFLLQATVVDILFRIFSDLDRFAVPFRPYP